VRVTEQVVHQGRILNAERWAFDFLVRRGARREVFDGLELTVVAYSLGDSSFEIELDWTDLLTTVMVCNDADEWPGGGIMSRNGRPVRRMLTRAFALADIPTDALRARCRAVDANWGEDRMIGMLKAEARTLEEHVDTLLGSWDHIFAA